MIERKYDILAAEGMHARPATAVVKLAKSFQSEIHVKRGDKSVKLNSLLTLLSLGIKGGEVIDVEISGVDEVAAAAALDIFFEANLKDW